MSRTRRLMGGIVTLAAITAVGAAEPEPSPCPVTTVVRGADQTPRAYVAAGRSAASHRDEACRAAGLAALAVADRGSGSACRSLERIELGRRIDTVEGAAALEAELAWRCGRPRRAHAAAVRAVEADAGNVLAATVTARVLEARLRTEPARQLFESVLERAPEAVEALRGMARLSADRGARRGYLERYLAAAEGAREPWERRRAVLDSIALDRQLEDRELWVVDRAKLPGKIRLRGLVARPGAVSAWLVRCAVGERDRVPALVDSGASGLHLARRTARRAEMDALAGGTLFGGGGEDRHAVERGILSRLDFGPLAFREALGVAAAGDLHPRGTYRAIVGLDLFSGLRLVLDPDERELWLLEAEGPGGGSPAEAWRVDPWPGEAERAPVLRIAGQLLVPIVVRDSEGRHAREVLALFDTGAERSMISPRLAEAVGGTDVSWSRRLRGYGGGLDVRGAVGRLEVQLGEKRIPLRDVPVVGDLELRGQLGGAAVQAVVGMDGISRRRSVIDLASGWITLSAER